MINSCVSTTKERIFFLDNTSVCNTSVSLRSHQAFFEFVTINDDLDFINF